MVKYSFYWGSRNALIPKGKSPGINRGFFFSFYFNYSRLRRVSCQLYVFWNVWVKRFGGLTSEFAGVLRVFARKKVLGAG